MLLCSGDSTSHIEMQRHELGWVEKNSRRRCYLSESWQKDKTWIIERHRWEGILGKIHARYPWVEVIKKWHLGTVRQPVLLEWSVFDIINSSTGYNLIEAELLSFLIRRMKCRKLRIKQHDKFSDLDHRWGCKNGKATFRSYFWGKMYIRLCLVRFRIGS